MGNTMLKGLLAAVAIAAAVECAYAVSAKSYIQDGLVFHLDAIANNGVDANGNDVHASLSASPWWRELVGNGAMKRTASKAVTWGANYVDFPETVAYSNAFPAVLSALKKHSLTAEIFLQPKTYKKYGGYFHLGGQANHRYLTLEMGEEDSTMPSYKGAFTRLQAYDNAWGSNADILINASTKPYFNTDVHATITVDGIGSHLAFDDGPIVHTNPSGKFAPVNDIVMVGAYSAYPAKARYYAFRIYNRVLEDWELRYNRELDMIRFKSADNVAMRILNLTAPGEIATHGDSHIAANGTSATFTNASVSSPSNTCTVVGYTHYAEDGSTIATGSGGEYTCTLDKTTMQCSRLEWNVSVRNRLYLSTVGTGDITGNSVDSFFDAAGNAVLTATPASGSRFVRWDGDLPDDADALNSVLTLPMDRPRNVKAIFHDDSAPAQYIALDWIESTGREWIDTGVKVAGANDVEARLQPLSCGINLPSTTFDNETSYSLYGGGDAPGLNEMKVVSTCVFGTNAYIKTCYCGSGELLPDTGAAWYNAMSNMTAKSATHGVLSAGPAVYTYQRADGVVKFKVNGYAYSKGHTASDFVSTNNFYIFNANTPGADTYPCNARVWYFKIYDSASGTLVRDFVPVKNAATGEVGLYDNVTEAFFGNASGSGAFIAGPMAESEWKGSDDGLFDYSVEWTIGGYTGSSRIENVPVLLRISEESITGFSYAKCLADGSDIAFSSEADFSNRLPYEIDEWNTGGTSLVWVKVPAISGTNTKIYMRYGRATPAGNLPASEVWSDYLAVWHLNGKGGSQGELDSSPRGNTATCAFQNDPFIVGAKVGHGVRFLTGNYLLSKNGLCRFRQTHDNMPQVFTASYWCKWDKHASNTAGLEAFNNVNPVGDRDRRYGWGWEWSSSNTSCPFYYGKTSNSGANFASIAQTFASSDITSWTYYTATSDGYNLRTYKNGSSLASNTYGSYIGGFDIPVRICGGGSKAASIADEVRISREPLSADRVAADYAMMTDAGFATASVAAKLRGSSITTAGKPAEYGSDVVQYGIDDSVSDGDVVTNAVSEFVFLEGRTDHRAVCLGWDLYNIVDGEDVFLRASTNTTVEGESFTNAIITVDDAMKIVWHWEEQYYISASTIGVSVSSPGYGAVSGEGWYAKGSSFTVTATPAEGYRFLCWSGGAGVNTSGELFGQSFTYTSGDNIPEYVAVFVPDDLDTVWLYLPSDARVLRTTGPKWVFNNVSCSGTRISIPVSAAHFEPASASALDMTGAVKDAAGNAYEFYRFTAPSYNLNLLGDTANSDKSKKITSVLLPESVTSVASGTFSFLSACANFDFLGNIATVTVRQFYNASSCRWIRFHYFPPTVNNTSDWTFYNCGAGDYKFRIEYPSYLENAWLCATNVGARYNYKDALTASQKSSALSAYRATFGSGAAEPNGYAALNLIKGVNNPKRKASLVSYVAPVKSGKVALGMMGLPYEVAKAETMSPSYGYHEYDTGAPIVVTAPKQFTTFTNAPYLCKGYILSDNPSVTNRYVSSFTLPGDVDANIGVTWVWKEYSGFKGLVISVK